MELTKLELLVLRKMIGENLDKKIGRIQYLNRQIMRGKANYEALALAEAEYNALLSTKEKVNDDIAIMLLMESGEET